ncbi:hypothetical protein [Flavobacterium sp.]
MCWKTLKYECSIRFETNIITGTQPGDRRALIHLVTNEFPHYPILHVAYIIDKFLSTKPDRLTSNAFIDFLKGYIKETDNPKPSYD